MAAVKRGPWASNPPVLSKASRHGVIRAAVLEHEFGMTRRTIYRRCLPGGPWRRLLPGIILLTAAEPNDRQRVEAALLRGGPHAQVTGLWAARLHGLQRHPRPTTVHLLVPDKRELTSCGFVVVERTTRLPRAVLRDGVPVAPAHRAVLDGARRMRDFDAIRAMLADAVQRGRCTPQDLAEELELGSQRGSALPRRALTELLGGAHSVPEGDAFWLWERAGLPPARRNVTICDAQGRYVGKPDVWSDDVALAAEVDSTEVHFGVNGYARTLARNNRYAAAGIVVVQLLPSRIRNEPEAVIAELQRAYAAAARRPRPAVQIAA